MSFLKLDVLLAALSLLLTTVGCGTDPDETDGDADGDVDGDAGGDADGDVECGEPDAVAFVTSDYVTGAAGLVDLGTWTSSPDLITLHSDAVVRCRCGEIVVLERLGGDNLTLLTADTMELIAQHSLGTRSNPYDAEFDGDWAYVSLYGNSELVAVDLASGEITARADLSAHADADGIAETAMVSRHGERLYVTLHLLDTNSETWDPAEAGKIAVLTMDPLEVEGVIQLELWNPNTDLVPGSEEGIVYIGAAGSWTVGDDGGIEEVDLTNGESLGVIIDGATLGGNITDFVMVSAELGYATVNDPAGDDALISFNPSMGEVIAELTTSPGWSLTDVLLDGRGQLLVVDRNPTAAGIRVFDAANGEELEGSPLSTGMPPYDMCLVPSVTN